MQQLLDRGWAVSPGERFRLRSAPGIRITTTALTHEEAGRLAADLHAIVREQGVAIGVIATPAAAAQDVADQMVDAGITSILNFAPTVLNVGDDVAVSKVDLSKELQVLAYHEQRKASAQETAS